MLSAIQTTAIKTVYTGRLGQAVVRALAAEVPIAFEYNGFAYAVMMGTPEDLTDYAVGFSLSEGLIQNASQLEVLSIHEVPDGWILRLQLADLSAQQLLERVRLRITEGSCGLCGLESIQAALRPLPKVQPNFRTYPFAVLNALRSLPDRQPLGVQTGAMHVAAFCEPDGRIVCAREDIGRHNALDKLIGAMAIANRSMSDGFVLVSARCSYELVEKTVRAGCPMLVSISAASDLAIRRAKEAGLTLAALARDDNMLIFHDPAGMLIGGQHGL